MVQNLKVSQEQQLEELYYFEVDFVKFKISLKFNQKSLLKSKA